MSLQEEKKLVKHAFKAKQSQYSNRCKETWSWERTKEGSVHLCVFMCIFVYLCECGRTRCVVSWQVGSEEIKWDQKEIRIRAASFSTHTCTALLSLRVTHTYTPSLICSVWIWTFDFHSDFEGFLLSGSRLVSDRQMEPEATRGSFKCSEAVLDKPEAAAGRHD